MFTANHVADFVGETTANIAANAMTGGAYGLASSGINLIVANKENANLPAIKDGDTLYFAVELAYDGNLTEFCINETPSKSFFIQYIYSNQIYRDIA